MINLEEKHEGANIILDRVNANIKKDKVSAIGYGLYYIKVEIDDVAMRRQVMSWDEMMKVGRGGSKTTSVKNRLTFRGDRNYSSRMRGRKS